MTVTSIATARDALGSALQVQGAAVQTAAVNIANVDTPGYQAQRGRIVSRPPGAAYVPLAASGPVDLGGQAVDLTIAKTGYEAAAHAYSAIDRTEKKVLDTLIA